MKILFLSHRLPYPPDKGERIRAFHELKYLAQRHDVDLMCFADSEADAAHEGACRAMCRRVTVEVLGSTARLSRAAWAAIRGESMSNAFFYSTRFARMVREALEQEKYDVVFVYCSSMGRFIPHGTSTPIVADFVDADSAKWGQYAQACTAPLSWLYRREARAVAASESDLGGRAALSLATTEHDSRELRAVSLGRFAVQVMPNGVEVPAAADTGDASEILGLKPFVVFVGTMSYRPNVDATVYFAREIFPLIRRSHPQLKFVIVGRDPHRRVQQLAKTDGVVVTGRVADVYGYLRNAEASVAPFRISQGFHNKIAESLAVGTPVVTSARAAAGIGLSEDEGLFTAEAPSEFAGKLETLLRDDSVRTRLRNGAHVVRKRLSWEMQLCKLEQQMLELVTSSGGLTGSPACEAVYS